MKRLFLSLLLAAALLLSACSPRLPAEQPDMTEEPTEPAAGIAAIDHCVVEPDERAAMNDADRAQYRRLMDAMLSRADSVTLDTDAERTAFLLELLRESPYAFFARDITARGATVSFTYAYPEQEQQRMLAFMDEQLLAVANRRAEPDDNELDIILKIYAAVCGRIDYDTMREDNKQLGSPLFDYPADEMYKALRDNTALCYGFAYVMRYALLQRGIDAFCVYGQCRARDMGHEWVIFRWDDAYFHCDPAWDRTDGDMSKLIYFGATDTERAADTLEMRPFGEYHLGDYGDIRCDDERFGIFRGIISCTPVGGHSYLLEDRKGNVTVFDSEDFSLKKDDPIGGATGGACC